MSGTITPTSLKSLLSQIEPAGAAARAARPAPQAAAPEPQTTAKADPRVSVPKDAVRFDPNAPRGTYVNLTV